MQFLRPQKGTFCSDEKALVKKSLTTAADGKRYMTSYHILGDNSYCILRENVYTGYI